MAEVFQNTQCQVSDDQLDAVFDLFRHPSAPHQMAYDEFFLALKEEASAERRASIRQAFRRLGPESEGLVETSKIIQAYNTQRHPDVSDGSRSAEEVLQEFSDTLKDHIGFRRGQRSYPTNLIAWEEFEDYYKTINGCYLTDEEFCSMMSKVWDLNKIPDASVESRAALARPAAGAPAKSRAGLHHWQTNTLPISATHHKVESCTRAEDVLQRVRQHIARKGLRAAVEVVQHFYEADDDVDDQIDVYEFRQACGKCGIALRHAEEISIFEACGSTAQGKLQVPKFIQLLQGELAAKRKEVVEQAFVTLGGDPTDRTSVVSPATMKDNFTAQAHPLVVRGQLQPGAVLAEFLDTFSLLAHVLGGCENGMVSFADFLAYYEVLSSTVDNDALFDLILQRVWSIPTQAAQQSPRGPREAWGEEPKSPRRNVLQRQEVDMPTAEPRPPIHDGPGAYAQPDSPGQQAQMPQSFRRFGHTSSCSPITKSSIVFNEAGNNELGLVIDRLRHSVGLRGLRGWKNFVQKFQQYDYRGKGSVMRLDFQRMHKSLGLGLSPEEQELLYKALSTGRRDASMDYLECLRLLRGVLNEDRVDAIQNLWNALSKDGYVATEDLKMSFDASSSAQCLLRVPRKDPHQAEAEWFDFVDFFIRGPACNAGQFQELFSMVAAVHEDDDEFRLMTTRAFGVN
eukprot:TRINITY_DN64102_c0_g1_i1.p1 TRINITY_DN64102_c0_g1~~TRINITY_DN64102_c0_g1_i1.p1  ORF type:complete len:800 (+),score=167.86 TRINITY_DN64102_c0_g1_i1:355-2400(+)